MNDEGRLKYNVWAASCCRISGAIILGLFFVLNFGLWFNLQSFLGSLVHPVNLISFLLAGLLLHSAKGIQKNEKKAGKVAVVVATILLISSIVNFHPSSIIGIILAASILIFLSLGWKELNQTS